MSKLNRSTCVCSHNGPNNNPLDQYFTPLVAVKAILSREKLSGGVTWDPASGQGHIAKYIPSCKASDISRAPFIYGEKGIDFFKCTHKVSNIITNPPYYVAEKFIRHSIGLATHKVIMLLRILFLESKSRYTLFTTIPPKIIYIFSGRIRMINIDGTMCGSKVGYAWYVWDKSYVGKTMIDWILK